MKLTIEIEQRTSETPGEIHYRAKVTNRGENGPIRQEAIESNSFSEKDTKRALVEMGSLMLGVSYSVSKIVRNTLDNPEEAQRKIKEDQISSCVSEIVRLVKT